MVWWDFFMIQFVVAGVLIHCCSVLWMMDVSVVSLGDAVLLTGIVVEWWIAMVMSHKQEEQRSLTSMLEFYRVINRFYMHLSFVYITLLKHWRSFLFFYTMFCRHCPCSMTDTMNPEMSYLSLWQLSRAKMHMTVGCYWRHSLCVSHVTWWWYFGEGWTYSESPGS